MQRSVFGCGVEIGIGLWVCRGLRGFVSAWVSLGGSRRGFRLRLSEWVAGFFAVEVLTCECRTLCCF